MKEGKVHVEPDVVEIEHFPKMSWYTPEFAEKPTTRSLGKARIDLVPPIAVYSMAEALTHGVDKHGEHNWRQKKIDIVKRTGSALRHIFKFLAGHDIDEDSGVHHLGCAMASLAVVLESINIHSDVDNRCPLPDHKLTTLYEA
jgi:hypothetical protein